MRLGQLARNLDTTPKEIVDYLTDKGIEVKSSHPNAKLDEEVENQVIAVFSSKSQVVDETPSPSTGGTPENESKEEATSDTDVEASAVAPKEDIKPAVEPDQQPEAVETELPANDLETEQESVVENQLSSDTKAENDSNPPAPNKEEENTSYEDVEVIKAPKIELPGLKVVGKIELPETKPAKTEEDTDSPAESEVTTKESEEVVPEVRYYKPERKPRNHNKKQKKPLTEEEKEKRRLKSKKAREKRLEEQARKEKEREERKIKEKRRKHYEKKLKQAQDKAAVKTNKKKKITQPKSTTRKRKEPQPKSLFGKFWKWLNT